MKNISSKPKRRSLRIGPKFEFSNTRDDPTEIEESKEEGSVQRENIGFTEDESKNKDNSTTSKGGHSSNDLLESKEGNFSVGHGSIGQTPLALLPSVPPMNTLPFIFFLFISFQVPYLCLSQVFPWSTLHLEIGEIPSLDLSFMDQTTPHVDSSSKPPIESDVAVALSTISHLLILELLSLSTVKKKKCFSCGYGSATIRFS